MIDLNKKLKVRTARFIAAGMGILTLAMVVLIDYAQTH